LALQQQHKHIQQSYAVLYIGKNLPLKAIINQSWFPPQSNWKQIKKMIMQKKKKKKKKKQGRERGEKKKKK